MFNSIEWKLLREDLLKSMVPCVIRCKVCWGESPPVGKCFWLLTTEQREIDTEEKFDFSVLFLCYFGHTTLRLLEVVIGRPKISTLGPTGPGSTEMKGYYTLPRSPELEPVYCHNRNTF